ncbi:hypothetical protein B0H34DRAFT_654539 [Crassisporium funariophilum]|nr:hypothetical protein B0H34DRAFT_654539 [Crassisporium funariophilum]
MKGASNNERCAIPSGPSKAFELPLELLMEIISYFNSLPTHSSNGAAFTWGAYSASGKMMAATSLERTHVLRSLSQTCKLWRNIFFPMLWERLEACATHSLSGAWYQVLGQSLIRKSTLVSENPELASHVRIILSRYSVSTVLPAFIAAIHALPNLHTLQILRTHHKMSSMLKSAFQGQIFPQVRTIVLPSYAHHILRCCPEVRTIVCCSWDDGSQLVSAMGKICRKVETVEGFRVDDKIMKRIVKAAPNLRSITFPGAIDVASVQRLASAKKLVHVGYTVPHCSFDDMMQRDTNAVACIKLAKEILRKSSGEGRKSIVVKQSHWISNLGSQSGWSKAIGINDSI